MDEYIEREALMRQIKEIHCADCNSYHGARCRACWVDDTLGYIESEPTADVVPVMYGRWIKHDDGVFTCSECGNAESNESHFCRYCGAKMMEG